MVSVLDQHSRFDPEGLGSLDHAEASFLYWAASLGRHHVHRPGAVVFACLAVRSARIADIHHTQSLVYSAHMDRCFQNQSRDPVGPFAEEQRHIQAALAEERYG